MNEPRPLFGNGVYLGRGATAEVKAVLRAAKVIHRLELSAARIELNTLVRQKLESQLDDMAAKENAPRTSTSFQSEFLPHMDATLVVASAYAMSIPPGEWNFDPKQWRPPCPSDRP
jgi:hypothetical protein